MTHTNNKMIVRFSGLALILMGLIFVISKVLPFSNRMNESTAQFIVLIPLLIYTVKQHPNVLQFNMRSFRKGMLLGSYIFLVMILNLLSSMKVITSIEYTLKAVALLLFINITIGLFEEILLRGLMFNGLLQYNSPMKAALISSLIFGVMHLLNFSHSKDVYGILSQVVYTLFVGMMFAAIYYITQNIWSVIVLHSLLDISSGFGDIAGLSDKVHTTTAGTAIFSVIIMLPMFIIGVYLLRKYQPKNREE